MTADEYDIESLPQRKETGLTHQPVPEQKHTVWLAIKEQAKASWRFMFWLHIFLTSGASTLLLSSLEIYDILLILAIFELSALLQFFLDVVRRYMSKNRAIPGHMTPVLTSEAPFKRELQHRFHEAKNTLLVWQCIIAIVTLAICLGDDADLGLGLFAYFETLLTGWFLHSTAQRHQQHVREQHLLTIEQSLIESEGTDPTANSLRTSSYWRTRLQVVRKEHSAQLRLLPSISLALATLCAFLLSLRHSEFSLELIIRFVLMDTFFFFVMLPIFFLLIVLSTGAKFILPNKTTRKTIEAELLLHQKRLTSDDVSGAISLSTNEQNHHKGGLTQTHEAGALTSTDSKPT